MQDPPSASRPPQRRIGPDMIAALSAVVIGVCALGVSLYQASVMRSQQAIMEAQQAASVWPYVEIGRSINDSGFQLLVFNQGVGPARLGAVRVRVGGETVGNWREALTRLDYEDREAPTFDFRLLHNRVLPPQERIEALTIEPDDGARSAFWAFEHVEIDVCYCSVFDRCWQAALGLKDPPRPVDDCSGIPEDEQFERASPF